MWQTQLPQEEEELHLIPYIVMQLNDVLILPPPNRKYKKETLWFSNPDHEAPSHIIEVSFVCNLSARWCCVIPAEALQIICLILDKNSINIQIM